MTFGIKSSVNTRQRISVNQEIHFLRRLHLINRHLAGFRRSTSRRFSDRFTAHIIEYAKLGLLCVIYLTFGSPGVIDPEI